MSWWSSLFRKARLEFDPDRELRFHLEQQIRDNGAAAMSLEKANRAAMLEFGGLDQVKEQCRDDARPRSSTSRVRICACRRNRAQAGEVPAPQDSVDQ